MRYETGLTPEVKSLEKLKRFINLQPPWPEVRAEVEGKIKALKKALVESQ